ncbi:peptide synthetase, putative, partial [Ixodes scapularis]
MVDKLWDNAYVLLAEPHKPRADSEEATPVPGHRIAYVMQTSGTTGEPKTVQVPHRCIVPNILHLRTIFTVSPRDVVFQAAPFTFDPSVVEVFLALTAGATLVMTSEAVKRIPRAVVRLLVESKVTVVQATPSFFSRLGAERVKESLLSRDATLRVLAFGGEACPSVAQLRSWSERGNCTEFYNLYGVTEVSCWATCQRIRLTDSSLQLFISTGGSNRRCLVGEETWRQIGQCQMRNSGDLVHKSGGNLTFLGRRDSIFKYSGRKVNPALLSRKLLDSAVVESCHAHFSKSEGTLFFFVTLPPNGDAEETLTSLKTDLERECTCPLRIIVVHHGLPVTSHGKLDMKALLRYARKRRRTGQTKPDGSVDSVACSRLLATLWN